MEAKASNPAPAAAPAAGAKPATKPKVVIEAYTFRNQGWPYVRKAATVFAICLLISIALVTAGRVILIRTKPDTAGAQQKQNAARERLNQAEAERMEIRDFLPRFKQLHARGFFGEENRLAMLEAIKDIQEKRRLLPIEYDFAPQQVVVVDPGLMGPELELHSSAVHLRMEMVHELDVLHFLQDLKQRGFFTVKDCEILASEGVTAEGARRLQADCTLYWLTIGPPAAGAVPAGGAAQ